MLSNNPVILLPLTTFLSAFLLFLIQPMVGRMLLPEFGGAPALWMCCLLFFQTVLVLGYAFAHCISAYSRRIQFTGLLMVAVAAVLLRIFHVERLMVTAETVPEVAALWRLAGIAGGVTFLLSATSPLAQRWWAGLGQENPHRLYALSNLGSLLALVSYPVTIEPLVPLGREFAIWDALFLLFGVAILWSAFRHATPRPRETAPIPWRSAVLWVGLSAAGSMLLSATTNQMTAEIAASPFLWVLPLILYLAAFILTFSSDGWYRPGLMTSLGAAAVMVVCAVEAMGTNIALWAMIAAYCAALFTGCMICFGELVRRRPESGALTAFYLATAFGGALGSGFVALAAPRLFDRYTEYPIALFACIAAGLLDWHRLSEGRTARLATIAIAAATVLATLTGDATPNILKRERNFSGLLQVSSRNDEAGAQLLLTHGTIVHGVEFTDPAKLTTPTAYYGTESGVGQVLRRISTKPLRVAVIGLGAGTLAAYGLTGDLYKFFEINPAVIEIARKDFAFLRKSKAFVETILGDARLSLQWQQDAFDALIVDAFSSDAIPTHLLTAECGRIYKRHLARDGALLIHISNRSVDLAPVVRGLAADMGLGIKRLHTAGDRSNATYAATWMLLTNNTALLDDPVLYVSEEKFTAKDRAPLLWTDDFSSLWPVLRF